MPAPTNVNSIIVAAEVHTANRTGLNINILWNKNSHTDRLGIVSLQASTDGGGNALEVTFQSAHSFSLGSSFVIVGSIGGTYDGEVTVTSVRSLTRVLVNKTATSAQTTNPAVTYALLIPAQYQVEIHRSETAIGPWSNLCTLVWEDNGAGLPTNYLDLLVEPGKVWYYRLRTGNQANEFSAWSSSYSNSISALPAPLAAPVLSATRNSPTQSTLTWTVANGAAKHWEIERAPTGTTNWSRIYYSATPEIRTSYVDNTAAAGVNYQYRVRHRFVILGTVNRTGASWQNQDDPHDVNKDGAVDWRDYRLVQSYRGFGGEDNPGNWPDFGASTCNPTPGNRPANDPLVDPPPTHATYAPLGAFVDVTGDGFVRTAADDLAMARRFSFNEPTPPRSAWSNIALVHRTGPGMLFGQPTSWLACDEPGQTGRTLRTLAGTTRRLVVNSGVVWLSINSMVLYMPLAVAPR